VTPRGAKTETPWAKNKVSDANILLMSKRERMKYFEEQYDDDDDDEGLPQMPGFGKFLDDLEKTKGRKQYRKFLQPIPNISPLQLSLSNYRVDSAESPPLRSDTSLKVAHLFTEQKPKTIHVRRQNFTPTSNHVKEITSVSPQNHVKQKIANKYWFISQLGYGSYGEVKLCEGIYEEVAIRVMNPKQLKKRVFAKNRNNARNDSMNPECSNVETESEVMKLMSSMNHRNVVKLHEIIDDLADDWIYLVMEYCDGGNLKQLCGKGSPNSFDFRNIFTQILAGLEYLHIHIRVAHGDLKPENILIRIIYADGQRKRVVKIADFGVARICQNVERSFLMQTPYIVYISPETIDAIADDFHAWPLDIWSAAVCGLEFLTGECPFASQDDSHVRIKEKIMNCEPDYPDIAPNLIDLFKGMLKKDPMKRLSIEDIKGTDWVLEDDWPNDIEEDSIAYASDCDVPEIQETDFMRKATQTISETL